MMLASARNGNTRSAFCAISLSTRARIDSSKPTCSRLEPMSTVPACDDSITAAVCRAASADWVAPK